VRCRGALALSTPGSIVIPTAFPFVLVFWAASATAAATTAFRIGASPSIIETLDPGLERHLGGSPPNDFSAVALEAMEARQVRNTIRDSGISTTTQVGILAMLSRGE